MSNPARRKAEEAFAAEGLTPETWSNVAGYSYSTHAHPYHKVLFCISGSITIHTPDGDVDLAAGDRIDLPPRTQHSATVGAEGVTCMEAPRA